MTGREKLIVLAAGVAVVWGGITFLQGKGTLGGRTAPTSGAAEAESFRNEAETQFRSVRMTSTERHVLQATREPWRNRLFRSDGPVLMSLTSNDDTSHAGQTYRYSGYAVVGNTHFAVINGRAYRVHDTLNNDSALVHDVTPDHVTLFFPLQQLTKIIPFEAKERERK